MRRSPHRALRTLSLLIAATCALLAAKCPGVTSGSDVATTPARDAGDTAGATMFGMRAVVTYQSQSRGILSARIARQYDEGMRYELEDATFMTRDSAGRDTVRTSAPRAVYDLRRPRIDFVGGAVVTGNAGRTLRTARASFDPVRNVLSGETTFVYTSVSPARQLSGSAFDADSRLLRVTARKPGAPSAPAKTPGSARPRR